MKKQPKMESPISLLVCIMDRVCLDDVEKYLSDNHLKGGLAFMGKGTGESDIADIFGFGMDDKDIIACFIPNSHKDKIVRDINNITGVEKDNYGLNMVLKVQSASSNLLELLGIKVGV